MKTDVDTDSTKDIRHELLRGCYVLIAAVIGASGLVFAALIQTGGFQLTASRAPTLPVAVLASTSTPQPTYTLYPTFTPYPTFAPVPPTSAPPPTARPVVAVQQIAIVSLKYDETGGIQFAQGQTQLVAIYLQRVQAGGSLEEAIQSIKQQAANARATVQEDNSISIPSLQAYFVWCPNADCVYPTNTSFPLKGFRQDYSKVAVIEVGENRTVQCPSSCWAVAVR